MPVSSVVDVHNRLVITLCVGEVPLAELTAASTELRNHSGFHPDFRQLIDLSRVTNLPLHFPDLYHLHQACDPFSKEGRRAVVAPDAVLFGLSRMYQLIVDSPNFEVFRSLPEALGWLGWYGTLQEELVRELLAKNPPIPPQSNTAAASDPPSVDLAEFLKRLHKASSA
jgi:hypothetical protein